jgi:L-amino acid N-acyltransferase YncA
MVTETKTKEALTQEYPKNVVLGGANFTLKLMSVRERDLMFGFVQSLREADILYIGQDVTQPDAIDTWLKDIENSRALSILAVDENGRVAAYATLNYNQMFWNRHIGEVRVMVSSAYRSRGLGTALTRELIGFARAMALSKVIGYMAVNDKGARRMFDEVGFQPEAILSDWVKSRDDRTYDLLIMSTNIED